MIRTLLNLSLVLAPAASFAVVINFDDINKSSSGSATWLGNRYQSQNILFSTDGSQLGAYLYSQLPSERNMVGGSDGPTQGEFDKRISGHFVGATNANEKMVTTSVAFTVRNAGFGSTSNDWDVRFYDVSGNELGRREGTGTNVLVSFTSPTANIHRFEFKPSNNNEGIDSLNFNTPVAAPVPEPGTVAALVLGVGALAARRRRSR